MTRKLTAVLAVSAAVLIVLGAYIAHRHTSQQTVQSAATTDQAAAPPAANPASGQAAATGQAAPASGGAVSTAQAADADSTSLERLAQVPASAALPSSTEWKAGTNYDVVSPAEPTTVAPGKVEVLEVFWLGCPHCYALEPYLRAWLKTKPDYIQFVRVPVMWGPIHRAHARLYYALESLGGDDLVEKVFTYIHDQESQSGSESVLASNSQEDTFRQQQAWAVQNGVNGNAFEKAYNSFYVNTQLQQADEITNAYQVQGVPFIAVDGKFTTDVGKASGGSDDPKKLLSVIDFLAAWEHDHRQGAG
ncbi:MAG TPA: thiol:disulfide interchange protein DsbA/DsbL [Steroidobacteraceae bacterium]|jgi:thiol:disulfide interchange protein DsbA|nr:thiol:disulfide interchange protein DsbA/DsbL [Steroidobacteraceae bacterium]